jgi:type I restriction enzyme M protein
VLHKDQSDHELGFGKVQAKAKVVKAKGVERVRVDVALAPLHEKDVENVGYVSDPEKNEMLIAAHLGQWVREPYERVGLRLGCEINFNQMFPRVVKVDTAIEVIRKLEAINKEVADLERKFAAALSQEGEA